MVYRSYVKYMIGIFIDFKDASIVTKKSCGIDTGGMWFMVIHRNPFVVHLYGT